MYVGAYYSPIGGKPTLVTSSSNVGIKYKTKVYFFTKKGGGYYATFDETRRISPVRQENILNPVL